MDFKQYFLVHENFENVFKLLQNPEHNDIPWWDVMEKFKASGGKELGSGAFGLVLTHPSWNYVIKIFKHDDCYLRFVRYAMKNPSPHFPKFYDKPRRIYPNYARHSGDEQIYFVRTELLYPISTEEWWDIVRIKNTLSRHNSAIEDTYPDRRHELVDILKKNRNILPFTQAYDKLYLTDFFKDCAEDFKKGNIMKDEHGTYVLVDPTWIGETPEGLAQQTMAELLDYGGGYSSDDYKPPPPMIKGGQRAPKIKQKKKPSPQELYDLSVAQSKEQKYADDDVPF